MTRTTKIFRNYIPILACEYLNEQSISISKAPSSICLLCITRDLGNIKPKMKKHNKCTLTFSPSENRRI